MYVNTLMLQDVLAENDWSDLLTLEDRRGLTPLFGSTYCPLLARRARVDGRALPDSAGLGVEVHAMVEGAIRHGTTMKVEGNYVDSHGQSEIGFGIARLLGFDLLPRIKQINKGSP